MKWIEQKRLKMLFEISSFNTPVWDICFEYFRENGIDRFTTTGRIPTAEVMEIYGRRYKNSLNGDKRIEGFKELISELRNFKESHIKIHSFGKPDQTFVIFTDAKVKLLLGILISDKHDTKEISS